MTRIFLYDELNSQVQDGKPSELQFARFGLIYHPIENGWKILPFKSYIVNGREFHPNAISVVLDGFNIQLQSFNFRMELTSKILKHV